MSRTRKYCSEHNVDPRRILSRDLISADRSDRVIVLGNRVDDRTPGGVSIIYFKGRILGENEREEWKQTLIIKATTYGCVVYCINVIAQNSSLFAAFNFRNLY